MLTRLSRMLVPTLREAPADAELPSHRLMLRAGLIRRLGDAAGLYTLLPLGRAALARIEAIIREEMDGIGGQEVVLPIVQPAELWRQSGRWEVYGDEMWRVRDRHGREYCLGPTHEEAMTDLVRSEVRSWRQLPLLLYQIQNKYRDERRPRFGMLRAREFLMKDGYSFHRDQADLERCYQDVYAAYSRIFARCGLDVRAVLADPGAIGGRGTHEFMALADAGEAEVVFCPRCDYAANVEEADVALPAGGAGAEPADAAGPPRRVATPGAHTIDEVAARLGVSPGAVAKTLFYVAEYGGGRPQALVAAVVPGDRQLNEVKLANGVGATRLRPAERDEVPAPLGSAGPVGLAGAALFTDARVAKGGPWVVGANDEGFHLIGAVAGRDFEPGVVADLLAARAGDACPACGAGLSLRRGIEVGQVFGLGTKYSSALKAHYLDEAGAERPMVMGCYGIGVTRTLAAIVEQHHDEQGIRWPAAVAPFDCVVVPLGAGAAGAQALAAAEVLAEGLAAEGVRAVLDDRDERPGVKFKDADLVGYPERVTLGRALADGLVEWKGRGEAEARLVPLTEAAGLVAARGRAARGDAAAAGVAR